MCHLKTVLPLLLLAALTNGMGIYNGSCTSTKPKTVPEFNPVKFGGTWHVILNYNESNPGSLNEDRRIWEVVGSARGFNFTQERTSSNVTARGKASLMMEDNTTYLNFTGDGDVEMFIALIVSLDYNKHAVFWACQDLTEDPATHIQEVIVFTREEKNMEAVKGLVTSLHLPTDHLKQINHTHSTN